MASATTAMMRRGAVTVSRAIRRSNVSSLVPQHRPLRIRAPLVAGSLLRPHHRQPVRRSRLRRWRTCSALTPAPRCAPRHVQERNVYKDSLAAPGFRLTNDLAVIRHRRSHPWAGRGVVDEVMSRFWIRTGQVAAVAAGSTLLAFGLPSAAAAPSFDSQGYLDSTARCSGSAVLFGSTDTSRVAICTSSGGGYEYRGVRVRDGAKLILTATQSGSGTFVAENDGITYTVSSSGLTVSSGRTTIRTESWEDFHGSRPRSRPADRPRRPPRRPERPPRRRHRHRHRPPRRRRPRCRRRCPPRWVAAAARGTPPSPRDFISKPGRPRG